MTRDMQATIELTNEYVILRHSGKKNTKLGTVTEMFVRVVRRLSSVTWLHRVDVLMDSSI